MDRYFLIALCVAQIVLYLLFLVRTTNRTRLGVALAMLGILLGVTGIAYPESSPVTSAVNLVFWVLFVLYFRQQKAKLKAP